MKSVIDEKTRIMVVDDDKEIREVISVTSLDKGTQPFVVCDG